MRSLYCLLIIGPVMLLPACGGGAITPTPLPTVSLAAVSLTIDAGQATMLTWSSSNATSCRASGAWSGTLAASGSQDTGALDADTTYALACTGAGGTSQTATLTVMVNALPTAQVTANPAVIPAGSQSTLTWSSTHAASCAASGGWSGTLAASGTQITAPLAATTVFSLTCSGAGGTSAPASTTVTLIPVPTVVLTAAPSAVVSGQAALLSWSSSGAATCTASGAWSGAQAVSGTQSTPALSSAATYSLSCTGPGGGSSASTTVNVIPTASVSVYPSVVAPGDASTLTWSATNASSCTAADGWSGTLPSSGTQPTGAVETTTSYSLSCTGAGGSSAVASAALTVSSVSMSLAPQNAALTLGRTQQFAATVPGGGAATWTVDGIANGNATVGTITAAGLYTAGAAGVHTIVATSTANSTQAASAVAAVTDLAGIYTYHDDAARDGANTQEYALNPANVNAASFGKLASCPVDGAIYGQPLWVANLTMGGAKHNVVFVTTQHDTLFAFDGESNTCVKLWSISLIDAGHGGSSGELPVPSTSVGNGFGDIQPEIGVNGTPVIDASSGTLYVVSKSIDSTLSVFYQRLHAIDIASGAERTASPVSIAGSFPGTGSGGSTVAFSTKQQNQRAGLALVNGTVFIAWGSHEDSSPWYGWLMGYLYAGGAWTQTAVFNSTPNVRGGGIWMGGGAPAVDASNHLYFLTGNGGFDANNVSAPNDDYGDSLLQADTSLNITSYFTPSDELDDDQSDRDFGSGGAAVLADLPAGNTVTHALVCGGKDGTLYVLNRDLLGGFGDSAAAQILPLGHGLFSTAAIWNNRLFAAGSGGPLTSYQLNTSTGPIHAGHLVQPCVRLSGSHSLGLRGGHSERRGVGSRHAQLLHPAIRGLRTGRAARLRRGQFIDRTVEQQHECGGCGRQCGQIFSAYRGQWPRVCGHARQ